MIDMLFRRTCNPSSEVTMPSIVIFPSGSARRNKAEISELFPAPVLPTSPTCNEFNFNYSPLYIKHIEVRNK